MKKLFKYLTIILLSSSVITYASEEKSKETKEEKKLTVVDDTKNVITIKNLDDFKSFLSEQKKKSEKILNEMKDYKKEWDIFIKGEKIKVEGYFSLLLSSINKTKIKDEVVGLYQFLEERQKDFCDALDLAGTIKDEKPEDVVTKIVEEAEKFAAELGEAFELKGVDKLIEEYDQEIVKEKTPKVKKKFIYDRSKLLNALKNFGHAVTGHIDDMKILEGKISKDILKKKQDAYNVLKDIEKNSRRIDDKELQETVKNLKDEFHYACTKGNASKDFLEHFLGGDLDLEKEYQGYRDTIFDLLDSD